MKFPEKLWTIVNECTSGAIGWGIDGDTIFIDYTKFEIEFFGEKSYVFKTKSVVSFVRQLNLYGFRKCSRYNDVHEFRNQYFVRGRKDLLKYLKRTLGYKLDASGKPIKHKTSEEVKYKEKHVPTTVNTNSSTTSVNADSSTTSTDLFRPTLYPFSSQQARNYMSYNWWRNPYFPLHCMYNSASESVNGTTQPGDAGEHPGAAYGRDGNMSWQNLDMYRNIVLVPVPAHQFGMFREFYNRNMILSNSMMRENESNSIAMPQVTSIQEEKNAE